MQSAAQALWERPHLERAELLTTRQRVFHFADDAPGTPLRAAHLPEVREEYSRGAWIERRRRILRAQRASSGRKCRSDFSGYLAAPQSMLGRSPRFVSNE